ncbi:YqhA family protein [Xanthobacter variabilis]|uniref:YqhA family protein n=1 Tax=Xanthobacter variabilis TaxID=3119932 RepID=UPI00374EFD07
MALLISRLVVLCRYALVPLFLGLTFALVLVVASFFMQLWAFAWRLASASETEVLMGLLSLIDLTLVGGLLVIIICSGYENFVGQIDRRHAEGWPGWMRRVSFSGLKQKLFASMMAIAGITLLKALMKLEISVSEAQVKWLALANVIFICGYAVLALTDHFTHHQGGERG